jgi:predicted peroxiredoxin
MIMRLAVAMLVLGTAVSSAQLLAQSAVAPPQRRGATILVHLTHGPENPTRAALALLVARTAIEAGDTVTIFLAGDAVQLMRDAVLDNLSGLGTGKLRESFDAIVKGGGRFYLSGMSSNTRGITDSDRRGKAAEFATPSVLLRPAKEHDRMFVY